MVVPVEPEERAKFRELNRVRMKLWRDRKRTRKYSPRMKTRKDGTLVPKKLEDKP